MPLKHSRTTGRYANIGDGRVGCALHSADMAATRQYSRQSRLRIEPQEMHSATQRLVLGGCGGSRGRSREPNNRGHGEEQVRTGRRRSLSMVSFCLYGWMLYSGASNFVRCTASSSPPQTERLQNSIQYLKLQNVIIQAYNSWIYNAPIRIAIVFTITTNVHGTSSFNHYA